MPPSSEPSLAAVTATELRALGDGEPENTYVLAVDLGTGGPKVAVISATGRIVAHAFEKVGIALGEDGSAEQSPDDWWNAVTSAAHRAVTESGVAPERVVGVGCTAQWSGTVAVRATLHRRGRRDWAGHLLDGLTRGHRGP